MSASPHPRTLRLAFVDLETTGTSATGDRITEVGIVTCDEHGFEEWSSLVNPETRISEFIESLTGISNEMMADAPLFKDIAAEVAARLEGRIFVAHNARFDHGFLKNEFRRLEQRFAPAVLCTVRLSRKLFPGFGRHNLDALIERHRLHVTTRHRALGDARLIWQFWNRLTETIEPGLLGTTVAALTARPSLPPQLDRALIEDLPDGPGVYLFYGDNDLPLYIGKARQIRKRVMAHFIGDHLAGKEMELSRQVRRVEARPCAGELGALLLEAALVRELMPIHNKRLRDEQQMTSWRLVDGVSAPGVPGAPGTPGSRAPRLQLAGQDDLFYGVDDDLYGLYPGPAQARHALRALAEGHQLCCARLGLEKVLPGKPCFGSQVGRCRGVCTGREDAAEHDARLRAALAPSRVTPWPWCGPVALAEGAALHVIDRWSYLGTAASAADLPAILARGRGRFERETYLLVRKYLARADCVVVPLELTPAAPSDLPGDARSRRRGRSPDRSAVPAG